VFCEEVKELKQVDLVYYDETGIDNNERYPYAYAKRGVKVLDDKPGHRTERLSILSAYAQGKWIAPMMVEGYVDSKVFETYCEHFLAKSLRSGQILILDNASFHKSPRVIEIFQKVGVQVKFLPPYCPHLNKIEKCWHGLKIKIRQKLTDFSGDLFKSAQFAFAELNL
jgi:transposase